MHFPRPSLAAAMLAAALGASHYDHGPRTQSKERSHALQDVLRMLAEDKRDIRAAKRVEQRDLSELGQRRARQYVRDLGLTRLRKIDGRRRPLRLKNAGKIVNRIQKR